jgi:hypothetical protein
MPSHYDIIIIGTGPGGGTLAYKLAPSGKKILLLERGGYLPREKDNWSSKTVFIDDKYKAKETWKEKDGGTFHPGIHYNVGGNSKVYGMEMVLFFLAMLKLLMTYLTSAFARLLLGPPPAPVIIASDGNEITFQVRCTGCGATVGKS